MRYFVYDVESFAYDYTVVVVDVATGETVLRCHNDGDAVKQLFGDRNNAFFSFNGSGYDKYMIPPIALGHSPGGVNAVSRWLIQHKDDPWNYPNKHPFYFNDIDIRKDMYEGLSLKAIEGHLGLPIRESSVDFKIKRELTPEEVEEVLSYNEYDVKRTLDVVKLRSNYFHTKQNLGKRSGIPVIKALQATNAKLTAMMLHAERKEYTDEREYTYPDGIDKSIIPKEIIEFYDRLKDDSIPFDELMKQELKIEIRGMMCVFRWGGVHGSLEADYEESNADWIIINVDVSSLYPSLLEIFNYISRSVPDPKLYFQIRADRIAAKNAHNKQLAKDLKLPLNTVSGAQGNKNNPLYDPRNTLSLRITGQLLLAMLLEQLISIQDLIPLNLNTDGIAFKCMRADLPRVEEICKNWEKMTGFELERDYIKRIWLKDVNNLLIEMDNGEIKKVGGYVNWGISEKGAWNINNNYIVCKKALIENLLNGTPVEETVYKDTDILDFQIIAAVGHSYDRVAHYRDGKYQEVQRCNRVYASPDYADGTLYKIKPYALTWEKVANLPLRCRIDNDNQLTLSDIDREWYVRKAQAMVDDFKGIKHKPLPKKITKPLIEGFKSTLGLNKQITIGEL